MAKCVLCKQHDPLRVIFMGFPMWYCWREQCRCIYGFWSWILFLVPFNGVLFAYDYRKIAYPVALWKWLFDNDTPEIHLDE